MRLAPIVLLAGAWLGTAAAAEPARLALVLANGAYAGHPALPACPDAGRRVGRELGRLGYEVMEGYDLSHGQMAAAAFAFSRAVASAAPGLQSVVYFCGHVAGYARRAFLLPVSAQVQLPSETRTQGLLAQFLAEAAFSPGGQGGLVLVDALSPLPGSGTAWIEDLRDRAQIGAMVAAPGRAQEDPRAALAEALGGAPSLADGSPSGLLAVLRGRLDGRDGLTLAWTAMSEPAAPPAAPPSSPAEVPLPVPAPLPPEPARPSPPAPPSEQRLRIDQRRYVQTMLNRLGYYGGPINGVFNPGVRRAIRQYQRQSGEVETGQLTEAQVRRLLFTMP